jgi:hypothetical protein
MAHPTAEQMSDLSADTYEAFGGRRGAFMAGVEAERARVVAWLKADAGEGGTSTDERAVLVAGVMAALAADLEGVTL